MTGTEAESTGRMTVNRASVMLLLVTLLWGASFTWTRSWHLAAQEIGMGELQASLTLIALRMTIALILLGMWQPKVLLEPNRREHLGGLLLGAVFFSGFILQTWGLAWTTPALSGFFTSLNSAWVPLLCFFFLREKVAPLTALGMAVALAGCGVLVDGWKLGLGEWLTVAGSFSFGVQILVLDHLGKHLKPAHLSAAFLAATGLLGLLGGIVCSLVDPGFSTWLGMTREMLAMPGVMRDLFLLALLPTVFAFHWMNTYQPLVPPSRAALIYLLEPVWSSLFSIWWGYDTLTGALILGGILIIGGNLLVELPRLIPLWRRGQ
ncbi:MAG: DMT family transporter [Gemmataceae bacterium]